MDGWAWKLPHLVKLLKIKEKGKFGIITDLFNTKEGGKERKKEHKARGSIKSKW